MNTKAANDAYPVSYWRAEFIDTAMEQAYQKHTQPETVRFLRSALQMWAALELFFGLPDWLMLGASEGFYVLTSIRVVHAVLLLWLAHQLLEKPHWAILGWPVTIVAIVGYPLYFIYPLYVPSFETLGFAIIMLLLIGMYVFIPNRLMLTNLIAAFGIFFAVASRVMQGAGVAELPQMLMLLLWPALAGYSAAIRINIGSRRAFVLWQQAEQTNQRLASEIKHSKDLEAELKRQALTDPLTGLSNRRHYEMLFEREHERCRRHKSPMTVGMIDLDHFKRVNDTYGHDVGDEVLKFVAKVMQLPLRQTDILGRFGGEEFIVILPDTSLEQAQAIAERMRRALEDDALMHGDVRISITATFGLTQVRADDVDLQDCVRRADDALYEGKRSGRNRVTLAEAA